MFKMNYFGLMFVAIISTSVCTELKTVTVAGAGATFPEEVYNTWMAGYKATRSEYITLKMSYDPLGSGHGKSRIKGDLDPPVHYAGSDSVLTVADYVLHPELQMFPTIAGPLVLAYNIPGITTLVLSREVIVGIYNGTVRYWNDTLIQDKNPSLFLPYEKIIPCARKEKSGTTEIFTRALSSFSADWDTTLGHFSQGINDTSGLPYHWDSSVVQCFGKRITGIADTIKDHTYSIGYTSGLLANQVGLPYAAITNRAGNTIMMNITSVQSAMNDMSANMNSDFTTTLVDPPGAWSYPISGYTYMIIRKSTTTPDCSSMIELVRYILWFLEDEQAKEDALHFQMIPASPAIIEKIKTEVINHITCNGKIAVELLEKQIYDEWLSKQTWRTPVFIISPIIAVIILALISYLVYQKIKYHRMLDSDAWNIKVDDISFQMPTNSKSSSMTTLFSQKSFSFQVLPLKGDVMFDTDATSWMGKWNDYSVSLRIFPLPDVTSFNKECTRMMIWIRENITHDNVVKFFGLTKSEKIRYSVVEYSSRGCLSDILQTDKFNLGESFPYSVSKDIVAGMTFLHGKGIIHGNLKSSYCLLDTKWSVKIVMWEFNHLYNCMMHSKKLKDQLKISPIQAVRKSFEDEGQYAMYFSDFWTAPEILLSDYKMNLTKACDVYSFAIILQEIFTKEDPYHELTVNYSPREIVELIKDRKVRPALCPEMPAKMKKIMQTSWKNDPMDRPTFREISSLLKKANPYKNTSVLDNMIKAIDEYMNSLELKVESNNRYDALLSQTVPCELLPRVINGDVIQPDIHEAALLHIYRCDKTNGPSLHKDSKNIWHISSQMTSLIQGESNKARVQMVYQCPRSWVIYAGKFTSHSKNPTETLADFIFYLYEKELFQSVSQKGQLVGAALYTGEVLGGVETNDTIPRFNIQGEILDEIMTVSDEVKHGCVVVNGRAKDCISNNKFTFTEKVGKNHINLYFLHCDDLSHPDIDVTINSILHDNRPSLTEINC